MWWALDKHKVLMKYVGLIKDMYNNIVKGGPGASGRVLPPETGRSWVRVAVFSHCTGEGKACH